MLEVNLVLLIEDSFREWEGGKGALQPKERVLTPITVKWKLKALPPEYLIYYIIARETSRPKGT